MSGEPTPEQMEDGHEAGLEPSNGILAGTVRIALTLYLIPAILAVFLVGGGAILISASVRAISALAARLGIKPQPPDDPR